MANEPEPPRQSLTPWALLERLERKVADRREVRLRWETAFVLVEALRAYIANPKREIIAAIICMRWHGKRKACEPLCRKCLDMGYELKCLMRGEPDHFGDRGWYDGGGRIQHKDRSMISGRELMPDMTIRRSEAADDHAVGELLVNAFDSQYSRKMPEARATPARNADLRNQAEKRETATVLVAELDGKIVGAITIAPYGAPSNDAWIPGAVDLRYLAIDPEYQGRGLSKTLLDEAERIAWGMNVPAICLHVRRGVAGVARLYQARGYVRDKSGDLDRLPAVFLEAYALRR